MDPKEIAEVINRSANQAQGLSEFWWLAQQRLPEEIAQKFTKSLAAQFYKQYKDDGLAFARQFAVDHLAASHA